jgi:DNA repair protein RecO (recombination protein O)
MLLATRGIVFRTLKYGETSVICDIFTEDRGLHAFIAGNVRSARARMPYPLFQPMSVVELVAYFREGEGALSRLKEARAGWVYERIPFDVTRGAIALFMAEICRKCIRESEENRYLFDFLIEQLVWLDRTEHSVANLHLHFLVHLSAYLGFQPQDETDDDGAFFDLQEGVFVLQQPMHGPFLGPDEAWLLKAFLLTPPEECHTIALDRMQRRKLLQRLLQFYELHVPGFGEMNTVEILETVFE